MNNEIEYKMVEEEELIEVADRFGYSEEYGMGMFNATKFLLQHQYKSKYTLWIMEEVLKDDEDGLWEELKHSMKDWEKEYEEKILKEI